MNTINIIDIITYLNVLEQFAIHVSISNFDVVDVIKYVNKLYWNDIIHRKNFDIDLQSHINPYLIADEYLKKIDKNILKLNYQPLEFRKEITFIY